jgi:hypothetical protein
MPPMWGRCGRDFLGPEEAGSGQAKRRRLIARANSVPGAAMADGQARAVLAQILSQAADERETTREPEGACLTLFPRRGQLALTLKRF